MVMDEKEIKSIELEIQNIITLRNNYINIIVIIFGGIIGLFFAELNILRISLTIIGLILNALFITVIINCSYKIHTKIEELKK